MFCPLILMRDGCSATENPTPCLSASLSTLENMSQKCSMKLSEMSGYVADRTVFFNAIYADLRQLLNIAVGFVLRVERSLNTGATGLLHNL